MRRAHPRIKGDGSRVHWISTRPRRGGLRVAGVDVANVGQVITGRGTVPYNYLQPTASSLLYKTQQLLGKTKLQSIARQMEKRKTSKLEDVLDTCMFLQGFGLPDDLPLMASNHHYAHALSALFFTDWDNALLYTSDGGGDQFLLRLPLQRRSPRHALRWGQRDAFTTVHRRPVSGRFTAR